MAGHRRAPCTRRPTPTIAPPRTGMSAADTRWFVDRLECPDCAAPVSLGDAEYFCTVCGHVFPIRAGQLLCFVSDDARTTLEIPVRQVNRPWPPWRPPPDGSYHGPLTARTNSRHLSILAARHGCLDVLDWGCGTAEYRSLVRDVLRHRYVGVDVAGAGADVLADVHRLPFCEESFDHVITNATLEHVANPFVAVREVARVLRRGGVFSGSAAFLEPSHHASHFHLAPDGIVHVLRTSGLAVEALWPQE